jgi:hypothetical protein
MRVLAIAVVLSATGCGAYHTPPVSVYGKSGQAYTAPSICAALTQCMKAEPSCFYDTTTIVTSSASGGTLLETTACKEVKK